MKYLGDFAEDATVQVYFTTNDGAGGAVAPSSAFEAADVKIYKDGSDSEKTAVDGLTMTSPFDSIVGLHRLTIDTSNDTNDANFWVTGSDYTVILSPDETVDGETVVAVIATFSIENRFDEVDVTKWLGTTPLGLSSQRVQVDVQAIDGLASAATVLGLWLAEGVQTVADSGTTTTIVDAVLTQADGYWNGALLIFRTGTNIGRTAIITDFDAATDTLTFAPAVPDAVTTEGYVLIPGLGHADIAAISQDATAADNLKQACDNYSATRGLAGTALPAVVAGANGGVPLGDATGGVDITKIHGSALTETSSGYLVASFVKMFDVATPLLVASDVMRGTDSAATVSNLSTHDGKLDGLITTVGPGNWALATTVDARVSATLFTMAAGINANNAYNGMLVMVQDADDSHYEVRRVRDYTGSSKQIQLDNDFGFNVANGDDVRILSTGYAHVHLYEMAGSIDAVTNMRKEYLGTGYGAVLMRAAVDSITSQTVFVLATVSSVIPSTDDDAYNGCIVVFENPGDETQKSVGLIADYDGSSQTVTLESAPAFTIAGGTLVTILAGTQSVPISEITGATDIPATPTERQIAMLVYMWLRNDSFASALLRRIKNNAGTVVLEADMDDENGEFTMGKLGDP